MTSLMKRKKNDGKIFGKHKMCMENCYHALTHIISQKLLLSRCFISLKLKVNSQASCYLTSSITYLFILPIETSPLPGFQDTLLVLLFSYFTGLCFSVSLLVPPHLHNFLMWRHLRAQSLLFYFSLSMSTLQVIPSGFMSLIVI